ncbi:MAG: Poly(beta-D-mannuronate) epimerase 7 [Pseudomonadota bacterium]|jgi:hypothetical protein
MKKSINVRPLVMAGLLFSLTPAVARAQTLTPSIPTQISVGLGPAATNNESDENVVSPNANIVAFRSMASNLVQGDTNQLSDVFVRGTNGVISRVSVSGDGAQANGSSRGAALSQLEPNGAYGVAFVSNASNFVQGITNEEAQNGQVYLRLPHLNKTILISRGYEGSGFVAGMGGSSDHPSVVSLEGGAKFMVAFHSQAFNLVQGAAPPAGGSAPPKRIYIATVNASTGEVVLDALRAGTTNNPEVEFFDPVLNGSGTKMAFLTNSEELGWDNPNAFTYQVVMGTKANKGVFELISRSPLDGSPGFESSTSPSMSFDGNVVAFKTSAPNILNATSSSPSLVAYNLTSKQFSLINSNQLGERGNQYLFQFVRLDPKGRFATFTDSSDNYLAAGTDTNEREDIFVKDLVTGAIVRVNVGANGVQETDGVCGGPWLGTLGYNSQVLTVGFQSSGTAFLQYPHSSGGLGLVREVYRSTISFPPPTLEDKAVIETPPDVVPGPRKVTLRFQKFTLPPSLSSLEDLSSLASKVTYDVRLVRTTTKQQRKITTTRNRITLRNITPGTYTVRYRASGTTSAGKKITTRFSPRQTVKVTKR